jgi:hypothetical protein
MQKCGQVVVGFGEWIFLEVFFFFFGSVPPSCPGGGSQPLDIVSLVPMRVGWGLLPFSITASVTMMGRGGGGPGRIQSQMAVAT